jgi:hypothetical protein
MENAPARIEPRYSLLLHKKNSCNAVFWIQEVKRTGMWAIKRIGGLATVAMILPLLLSQPNAVAADEEDAKTETKTASYVLLGQRQLFLDDNDIAKIENLVRTMHQPAKKGAVIRPSFPGETSVQTRSAPVWDPEQKVFKLWLHCCPVVCVGHYCN